MSRVLKPVLGQQLQLGHFLSQDILCWLMNEGSGNIIRDISCNAISGTIIGSDWVGGRVGTALSFNGSTDYIVCDESSAIDSIGDKLTISVWVYLDSAADNSTRTICSFYVDNGERFEVFVSATGYDHIKVHNDIDNVGDEYHFGQAARTLDTQDKWTLWTLVIDDLILSIYKNGLFIATETMDVNPFGTLEPSRQLFLGCSGYGTPPTGFYNPWMGKMDNFSLYNRALTAQEIMKLYIDPFCIFEEDGL